MKLQALLILTLSLPLSAAPKKPAPVKAVQAQPAQPAQPSTPGSGAKPSTLISSDMSGKDIGFITQAIDLGKGLAFLAEQTAKTTNPRLQSYGSELAKSLAMQEAVLSSAAEMRNVKPPEQSAVQQQYAAKFANFQGAKLEKAILDAFIELDQRVITIYEANEKSADATIAKFVADALPKSREHLAAVQSLSGISPKRAAAPVAPAPVVPKPEPTPKTEPAPVAKTEPAAKPAPVAAVQPEPVAKPAATPAPKPEPVAKAEPAPKPAPVVKPEPIAKTAPAPKPEAAPKAEPEAPKATPPARPAFRTNIPAPIN